MIASLVALLVATSALPEESVVKTLPAPSPHWVFVTDLSASAMTAGRIWVVDGDEQRVLGSISAGYVANLALAPDASALYVTETYWSRGARGTRTDVVTTYDPRTLSPTREALLTQGRFLTGTKLFALQPTEDGAYLLSANMRPATSISLIDVAQNRHVAEIATPGCVLAYPYAKRRFFSLCGDGALLDVRFGPSGAVERTRGKPFFDPVKDPVFEHPARARGSRHFYFLSYGGQVHPVEVARGMPRPQIPWAAVDDAERAAGWRPGGTQPIALHASSKRLLVLMHQGGAWTHKASGSEIWVFDSQTGRRLAREKLAHPAQTLAVTHDEQPLVFTTDGGGGLSTYRFSSGRLAPVGTMTEVGTWTTALSVPGD